MKNKEIFMIFKKMINKDNPTILEAGAHYGEDSKRFLDTFSNVNLFCFEPDPRNVKIIKKYVSDPRLNLSEVAISSYDGYIDFYQSYDEVTKKNIDKYYWIDPQEYRDLKLSRSGASSIKKGIDNVAKIKVQAIKIDTWMLTQNIDIIDLLWLDVQGAEREVFLGATNTLSKIRYIWVEYGAMMYEGSMTRKETRNFLKKKFKVIEKYSSQGKTGDLFLKNRILSK